MDGAAEGFLAGCVDLTGLTVVELVRRHQADASMVMILIIPIEEAAAERLCVLDAAEPLRKGGGFGPHRAAAIGIQGELAGATVSLTTASSNNGLNSPALSRRQCTRRRSCG